MPPGARRIVPAMSLRAELRRPDRRGLLAAGFLAFVVIGAAQALYGPAFPALRARFGVGLEVVGQIAAAHFLGSFAAIALSGALLTRFGYRRPLAWSALALAAGAAALALAPSWPLALAAAALLGIGFGVLDVGVNLLFARSFGAGAAPALNLLNALFGVGAVLGPVLVATLLPRVWLPFALVAAAALVVAALCVRVEDPPAPEAGEALPVRWSRVAGFVLLYFLYVSSEVGVASWETEHLAPAFGAASAARATALYWGALTVGRFVATPLSARVRPRDLVLGASALALVGVALAHVEPWAPWAYALTGFAFAPIFPTSLVWLAEVFPRRAEQIAPIAVAAANLGPVAAVPAIGWAVAASSSARIPSLLAVVVAALLLTVAGLWLRTRRP